MSAPAAGSFVQPRHLVVLGHPEARSFGAQVAQRYCQTVRAQGQEAELRDLYALDFDPRLRADERGEGGTSPGSDVAEDVALLGDADVIVLVYPMWFGMPPAIIKGYVDRVLGAGFGGAAIAQGLPHPVLAGKRLALFTSSAATRPWLEEKGQWRALRHAFETYLATIFGVRDAGHVHFDAIVPGMPARHAEECLAAVAEAAQAIAAATLAEKRALQSAVQRGAAGD